MQNRIVIFDLDGTIYQNSVFHRGYLRTLVAGTWAEPLEADLVRLAEAIFAGRELDMNRFYRRGRAEAATVPELPWALLKRVTDRVLSEVPGVCRVLYDLSPKPVGTIEWE